MNKISFLLYSIIGKSVSLNGPFTSTKINATFDDTKTMNVLTFKQNAKKSEEAEKPEPKPKG